MKKKLFLLALLILLSGSVNAAIVQDESELYESFLDVTTYLDTIVMDEPVDTSNMLFEFEIGDLSAFNGSTYYYFYQLENFITDGELASFSIDVAGSNILSAGYISNPLDLDETPFNHLSSGDHEFAQTALVLPSNMYLNPGFSGSGFFYS